MAKLAFSKLGLKINNLVTNICFNEQVIEVKHYLSVNDKLKLISDVINNSIDEHSFCNPVKVEVFAALGIIEHYTNITFTEKQKENPVKLFDLFQENGLMNEIQNAIPKEEFDSLMDGLWYSIESIYTYKNSAMGVIENLSTDYSNLDFDATAIQQKLGDGENVEFLKEVLTKLG